MNPVAAKRRAPRPVLLILVYGVFLVLIGVTASAQAVLVSEHFTASMLNAVVGNDSATVRAFVNGNLTRADLTGSASPERAGAVNAQLRALVARGAILRAEIRLPDGTVLFSDSDGAVGRLGGLTPEFQRTTNGQPSADLGASPATSQAVGEALPAQHLLREFLPIIADGKVQAVFAVWHDGATLLDTLGDTRRDIVAVTLAAAAIAAGALFFVFRSAQARITRQTEQLLEATRRDAFTGMLNHGATVTELTEAIEAARASDGNVTVAIVDIDNFRLLNDTHGHAAGDEALLAVARLLEAGLPEGVTCGQFGPDEFLLIAPSGSTAMLEPALVRITDQLVDLSLQFGAGERLPISISGGIAIYPDHADSVTALLSSATVTLADAKSSGGNTIRMTDVRAGTRETQSAFDVYQGLIIAIDTKDRYTKRHSEDVARYAAFLAGELGLEAELGPALRIAGLLHDVGKIGIPDDILRKPADLTESERLVIQQHVALGDSIVRNLSDIDQVRAAVRFHHERWDGRGYLDHLSGDEIPLIARIIAVGDVFSAMTTTRPYRKAMDVDEALRRLEDASGSQLEERLVVAFVGGMRSAADPPMPGQDARGSRLWTPNRAAA